jgi:hypothetical protein
MPANPLVLRSCVAIGTTDPAERALADLADGARRAPNFPDGPAPQRRAAPAPLALLPLMLLLTLAGCTRQRGASAPRKMPTPSVQVGACGGPGRDGVMSTSPKVDNADRDLDGDGRTEKIVVDRGMCTSDGNCYWNVFTTGRAAGECSRYAGTFEGSALETMASRGDDNMADVRGYWSLQGGRLLLQSYRFTRDGYQLVDALLCKRGSDDRLDCADTSH